MAIIKYSPSTGNFYPASIPYRNPPKDLIEVTVEDYDKAMSRPLGSTFAFKDDKLIIQPQPQPE